MSAKTRWLHEHLAFALEGAHEPIIEGFPKALILVRDPANPERYAVVGNESDEVQRAVVAAAYAAARGVEGVDDAPKAQ